MFGRTLGLKVDLPSILGYEIIPPAVFCFDAKTLLQGINYDLAAIGLASHNTSPSQPIKGVASAHRHGLKAYSWSRKLGVAAAAAAARAAAAAAAEATAAARPSTAAAGHSDNILRGTTARETWSHRSHQQVSDGAELQHLLQVTRGCSYSSSKKSSSSSRMRSKSSSSSKISSSSSHRRLGATLGSGAAAALSTAATPAAARAAGQAGSSSKTKSSRTSGQQQQKQERQDSQQQEQQEEQQDQQDQQQDQQEQQEQDQ
ncbi:hypothetical protein ACSSS7_007444 [Eimeria intestinalis]